MTVTNTPAKDLAYTNCAYCSPSDVGEFVVPGSDIALALVGDVFVLSVGYPSYRISKYIMCFVELFFGHWLMNYYETR